MDLGQGVASGGDGGELGDFFQYDRQAGEPAPAEVGHAAHRQQGRRGHARQHLQRSTQAKFPLLGPQVQEHLRPAPDAGPHHRLRRLQLRRRRPHPRPRSPTRNACSPTPSTWAPRSTPCRPRTTAASPRSRRSRASSPDGHQDPRDQDLHHQEPQRVRALSCWSSIPSATTSSWSTPTSPPRPASDFYRFEVKVAARQDAGPRSGHRGATSSAAACSSPTATTPDPLLHQPAGRQPGVKEALTEGAGARARLDKTARDRRAGAAVKVITDDQARLRPT